MIIKVNYTVSDIYMSTSVSPVYIKVVYSGTSSGGGTWGTITGTLSAQTDLQNALNAKFDDPTGTTAQYLRGDGTLATFPTIPSGTVTSVGLSMPSAFSVGSSPITSSGTLAVTGAGTTLQYIDGTGALQTLPTRLESDSLVALVRNQSGATMTKGTIVYISGATGNKPLISKALATGDATSAQTLGLLQTDIANNADGHIVIIGNVTDLDTSALTEGQQLYLSGTTAGTWTTTKPYAPIHLVYVAIVIRSHPTQGTLSVKVMNGFEMDELHNVSAQSPANNDGLFWNASTSLWSKNTISGVLGYTPVNPTRNISTTSPLVGGGDLSADRTLSIPAATTSVNGYLTSTDWTTFNGKQAALTITTTGTSGAATLVGATLNIPQYSGTNIYNASGSLTSARALTLNAFNLDFIGSVHTSRITAAGRFLLGTTTESTYILDAVGTARVSGNFLSGNGTYYLIGSQTIASVSNSSNAFIEISAASGNNSSLAYTKAGVLSTLWQVYTDSSNNYAVFRNGVNKEIFKIFESTKNVGIDEVSIGSTFTDVASAKLFVNSTTKGFLPPRMTSTQRDAISSPATGLVVYNTTLNSTDTYDGARWRTDSETITTNRQTASYTLVLADRGKLLEMNSASANTATIPLNSSVPFPIGSKIDVTQYGAGATTITATGGVTIRSFTSFLKLAGQYAACTLVKIGTDEWYAYGNLIA